LGDHHLVELALARFLKVVSEALLDDASMTKDVDKVIRPNLGEIVRDDDSRSVLPPLFDRLEDEQTGSTIESGSRFVCSKCISKE
jgi:hypothetical protein